MREGDAVGSEAQGWGRGLAPEADRVPPELTLPRIPHDDAVVAVPEDRVV